MRLYHLTNLILILLGLTYAPLFILPLLIINFFLMCIPFFPYSDLAEQAKAFEALQNVLHIKRPAAPSNVLGIQFFLYIFKSQYRLNQGRYSKPMAFLLACYQALSNELLSPKARHLFLIYCVLACWMVAFIYIFYMPTANAASILFFHWLPFCGLSLVIPLQILAFCINWRSKSPIFTKKKSIVLMLVTLPLLLLMGFASMPAILSNALFSNPHLLHTQDIINIYCLILVPAVLIVTVLLMNMTPINKEERDYKIASLQKGTQRLEKTIKQGIQQLQSKKNDQALAHQMLTTKQRLTQDIARRQEVAINTIPDDRSITHNIKRQTAIKNIENLHKNLKKTHRKTKQIIRVSQCLIKDLEYRDFLIKQRLCLTEFYYNDKNSIGEKLRLVSDTIQIVFSYISPHFNYKIEINGCHQPPVNFYNMFNQPKFSYLSIGAIEIPKDHEEEPDLTNSIACRTK